MPRFADRVVGPLSGRANAGASVFDRGGVEWDVAVAGQPFMLLYEDSNPLVRQTAPFRKDQTDQESEPGEQSLSGWWIRSQESFHGGAGVLYQEDRVSNDPTIRFKESMGVDPWTPGQVSLAKKATSLQATANTTLMAQGTDSGTPVVFQASGSTLYRITEAGVTTVTWGGASTIQALELTQSAYYVVDSAGVWKGTIAGGAGTKVWTIGSGFTSCVLRSTGGGVMLGLDRSCYDISDETGTLPKALPTAFIVFAETDFQWTASTVAQGSVRTAGYTGGQTFFWTFNYTGSGWLRYFTTGLPRGERVTAMGNYYNTYMVLGTNKGLRFAGYQNDSNGVSDLYTFGPLVWEIPSGGSAVSGVHTMGRYVYAAAPNGMPDGTSGLMRFDPETEISTGRFAYATDMLSHLTGAMGQVVDLNGRIVMCVTAQGSYVRHLTDLEPTGYMTVGRIRFRTMEPKLFKYLRIRTDALAGTVAVSAISDADSTAAVATYNVAGSVNLEEASLPQVLGPQESIALKFTMTPSGTDATKGPVMRSYQVKALPAPKRQRIIVLPLHCHDQERTNNGAHRGYDGFALDRLRALERAEEVGDLVLFQDFATGEVRLCAIDQMQFVQKLPRGKASADGDLTIQLRAVD